MEPVVTQGFCGSFRLVQITEHYVVTLYAQFANSAVGKFGVVFVVDFYFNVGQCQADGTNFNFVAGVYCANGSCFRKTVAFLGIFAKFFFESFGQMSRKRSAATYEPAQGSQVFRFCSAQEHLSESGDATELVNFMSNNQAQDVCNIVVILDNDCATFEHGACNAYSPAEAMMHGQYAESFIFRFHGDCIGEAVDVSDNVFVREHCTFGVTGGAAGVNNGAAFIFVHFYRSRNCFRSCSDFCEGDLFNRIAATFFQSCFHIHNFLNEHHFNACVFNDEGSFSGGEHKVDGYYYTTSFNDCVVSCYEFRAVFAEQANSFAFLQTFCLQISSPVINGLAQFAKSNYFIFENKC